MTDAARAVPRVAKKAVRSESPTRLALRHLARNRAAMAALGVTIFMVVVSVLAPVLAPYDPLVIDPMGSLQPPSIEHPMGTDPIGRDVLSRVMYGGRISLVVGLVSVGISLSIGVILGLLAGYSGGAVDNVVMRLMDMMLAFAGILLALTIVAVLGPGLVNVMLAVGIAGIPNFARLVRGSVLSAKENLYVEAARNIGARSGRIIFRHILPNVAAPVIVLATLAYGWAILSAASLSFLGLGAQPPTPEWGIMLSDGRGYMREALWVTFFPGLAIMLTVLAANILGDGLRDALDPRQRK